MHSVQFSDGFHDHVFLESPANLKKWLKSHRRLKVVYGFNVLCDLGAIKEWLGSGVKVAKYRGKLIGKIRYASTHLTAYDSQPLLNNFGLRRLSDIGELVGTPKLPKPPFLGLRKWESEEEHEAFKAYAVNDAIITSRATRWLIEQHDCDPGEYASAGTLAAKFFNFPPRYPRYGGRVDMPAIERVCAETTAGRSEAFVTGFISKVYYNDVKSLYPMSIVTTEALTIDGLVECDPCEVSIDRDLNNKEFGWIGGHFETKNPLWGLPILAKNVTYVTGDIAGVYHTFDLAAAKAEIISIDRVFRPVYNSARLKAHNLFASMLSKRVEGELDERESRFAKAVLNSTYGKLGQSHPEVSTTNYPAFSTILAHSHLVMSTLFDQCTSPILGMDTDSIFSQTDMSGKYGDLSDGEHSIPLLMEVKGKGDLAMFRAKTYMIREEDKPIKVYGRHVWHYFIEDYFDLWNRTDYPLTTRIEVKHTLKTRQKKALKLPLGFWCEKPVKLTEAKIRRLLKADNKRKRESYDSFSLFQDRKSQPSEPWTMRDAMYTTKIEYPRKSVQQFPYFHLAKYKISKKLFRAKYPWHEDRLDLF